ncbi:MULTISPECIES: hypothetical protein [unclassified Brucella]|uniref:hypothetical protein n=1 Tax=unclassified Brucella TaxID=2632610 RepID=UPI0012AD87BD|nr:MULTISPECIES: hypothetical protein [unclassified Brucella]MRN43432.1 hypothetical protein [Brucella sp. 09RB8913]MRN59406.1 hypothetical protein [Brucella sp. 09RB8918]MRN68002.1 hypothetical protein [Brucella sp. 10RB9213]
MAKDHPILFSGPMVRANLDGRKTITRRILKPQPQPDMALIGVYAPRLTAVFGYTTPNADCKIALRYMPGDRLWVREAWAPLSALTHNDPGAQALADRGFYRADNGTVDGEISRWRPSIHMPRWASRLTLIVTGVKIQRLQDISEEDAIAEGVERDSDGWRDYLMPHTQCCTNATDSFHTLWDHINGPGAWAANPWVVAYSYRAISKNIDLIAEAA